MSKIPYSARIASNPELAGRLARLGIAEHGEKIITRSMLSDGRLSAIIDALKRAPKGPTAEIGCSAGGASILIALLMGEEHWACDTFAGLADCDHRDDVRNGAFRSKSVSEVVAGFAPFKNIRVAKGYFPESAPQEMRDARYSFVHIDVDTYRSIHQCFEFFGERMLPGGIIALDDVIGRGLRGAKTAWKEILKAGGPWKVVSQHDPQVIVEFA